MFKIITYPSWPVHDCNCKMCKAKNPWVSCKVCSTSIRVGDKCLSYLMFNDNMDDEYICMGCVERIKELNISK